MGANQNKLGPGGSSPGGTGIKPRPGKASPGQGGVNQPSVLRQAKTATLTPTSDASDQRSEGTDGLTGVALEKPPAARSAPSAGGDGSRNEAGAGGEARPNRLDGPGPIQSKLLNDLGPGERAGTSGFGRGFGQRIDGDRSQEGGGHLGSSKATAILPPTPGPGSNPPPPSDPGASAYAAYVKAHPGASSLSTELAYKASLLLTHAGELSGAAGGPKNGKITKADLTAAGNDPGRSPDVRQAAMLFSNAGMFRLLDTASQNPATGKADGVVSQDDITSWIGTNAPTSEQDFRDTLTSASIGNLLSDADMSGLGPDVFANPGTYTGKQKAAVLQKLQEVASRIEAGQSEGLWSGGFGRDINPDETKVMAELQGHIDQLSQDKDVQAFIGTQGGMWLRPMIQGDPDFKAMYDARKANFLSGRSLDAEITMMGVKDGLAEFMKEAAFLAPAGRGGDFPPGYLARIVQGSPQYTKIMAYYENNIVTAKDLDADLNGGMDPRLASQTFAAEVMNFSAVLPPSLVANTGPILQGAYSDVIASHILGTGTKEDLDSAFGDPAGNLDAAKLNAIIGQALQQNPGLFKDENGKPIPPDQVVGATRQVWDLIRGGAKVSDALGKLKLPNLGKPGIQNAYGQGMLHAVSALLAGGIMAAKASKGTKDVKSAISNTASGTNMVGLLMEAGSKYASQNKGAGALLGLTGTELKQIENNGKMLGALGSAVSGALGIYAGVQSLAAGDKVAGGVNLANGISGLLAAGTSFADGALGLAGTLGVEIAGSLSAAVAGIAGTFSIGAGVVGIVGLVVSIVTAENKRDKVMGDFKDEVITALGQFGITGGGPGPGGNERRDPEPNDPIGRGRGGGRPW